MEKLYVLLFYKFVEMKDLEYFQRIHLKLCNKIGVLGKVLIGKEGINGSVSGTKSQVEEYKKSLISDKKFSDIVFKEDEVLNHPFTKMAVRIRNEIVTFGKEVDFSKKAEYISAEELYDMYQNKEVGEDFIILDARNDYEYKVGKFKGAEHLNIKNFREFADALEKVKGIKEKKIITYCTGGIRCEKAATYMRSKGFQKVLQLKDGILDFGKKFPDTFWEGKCFVFDKRLVTPINSTDFSKDTITECEICGIPCDLYKNCRNENCDRLVISCLECQEKYIGCCSESCLSELRKKFFEKSIRNHGRKVAKLNG